MAATITAVKRLIGQGEEGTLSAGGHSDTATYMVTVTEWQATPYEVANAAFTGLPVYGDAHTIDAALKVTQKTAKRMADKAKNHWSITVNWTVPTVGGGTDGDTDGETDDSNSIRITVQGVEQQVYTQTAYNSSVTPNDEAMVVNSVSYDVATVTFVDRYPDPIEISLFDEQISIDFQTLILDMDLIATSRGKINDDTVTFSIPQGDMTFSRTFARHTLLLKSIDYNVEISSVIFGLHVWGVRVVLLYRPDSWDKKLPDKGYRWFDADENFTAWKDSPQYLDGAGHRLEAGEELVPIPGGGENDGWQIYKEADLTTLLEGI